MRLLENDDTMTMLANLVTMGKVPIVYENLSRGLRKLFRDTITGSGVIISDFNNDTLSYFSVKSLFTIELDTNEITVLNAGEHNYRETYNQVVTLIKNSVKDIMKADVYVTEFYADFVENALKFYLEIAL